LEQVTLEDEGLFLPSTTLMHRAVFEAVGGFQAGCYHEDRVFFIQAAQKYPAFSTGQRLVIYQQSLSGRCRKILADYEKAVDAELSILEVLQDQLSAVSLEELKARQLLNLSNRFLMYGYLDFAWTVNNLLPSHVRRSGLKGKLAQLSLSMGFNFLASLRLCIQQGFYPLLGLGWALKMQSLKAHMSPKSVSNAAVPVGEYGAYQNADF
jgi:hypothetical protein